MGEVCGGEGGCATRPVDTTSGQKYWTRDRVIEYLQPKIAEHGLTTLTYEILHRLIPNTSARGLTPSLAISRLGGTLHAACQALNLDVQDSPWNLSTVHELLQDYINTTHITSFLHQDIIKITRNHSDLDTKTIYRYFGSLSRINAHFFSASEQ